MVENAPHYATYQERSASKELVADDKVADEAITDPPNGKLSSYLLTPLRLISTSPRC